MYQNTMIIGRLGGDPEVHHTADGGAVTSFSVATSRRWTDASGQPQERTVWFRVSAWRKLGETCAQYLGKGRLVMVEGSLSEPRPYEGRDGVWRASLNLTADSVKFLDGRGDSDTRGETANMQLLDEGIPF